MDKKVFQSQKYFLFKLSDILHNSFHVFEEKRLESLQFILQLCIETYEEMNSTAIGTDKLGKSYKGLLNSLVFQLKKHPYYSLDVYRSDFERISYMITNQTREDLTKTYELFMCLKSLKKKLQSENLGCQYIKCLKQEMSYANIDSLIEVLISDLLYMGYSLNYLSEWYKNLRDNKFYEAVNNQNLNTYIEKLNELDGSKKTYQIIIPFTVNSVSQRDIAEQLLRKHFEIKSKNDFINFHTEWKWEEKTYASKVYSATDYYKAIGMAKKDFAIDKELFAMWQNTTDVIRENINVACIDQNKLRIVDIRNVDYTKLISYFDKNRTEQLNTFIQLKDLMKNEDVDILERVLHTIHTAKGYNIQNQFLNFWSALEYTIFPFPKNSIIEKARVLVSESFALFYIKNKINIFWERLSYIMKKKNSDSEHPICNEFVDLCRDDKDFNTLKIVQFLHCDDKCAALLEELSFNVVLERELRELIMLVKEPTKLHKAITEYHEGIIHDLDCIYRLRNQLIHSAKSMDESLEHISLRLYRYVNSIVATILYYKKKNPNVSIIEILNSLHNTYEVYINNINPKKTTITDDEAYRMVRPKYLFLE